jgi:hypothetical protein
VPLERSQLTDAWHWDGAEQSLSCEQAQLLLCGVQVPAWQTSGPVQERPSSQALPVSGVCTQAPVDVLHEAAWQSSCAVQSTGAEPWQEPAWQVSTVVHALPSLHAMPSPLAGFEHAPFEGLQVPGVWH